MQLSQRRLAGAVLMGLGVIALIVAAVGTFTGGDGGTTTTTAIAASSTTSGGASSTTTSASSTSTTTTSTSTTTTSTTTTSTTTTTTLPPPLTAADAEAFISDFAAAIAEGDTDFLFNTMHSVVHDLYDDDLCRTYIDREILALVDYRVTGSTTSDSQSVDVNGQSVVINPMFHVPVTFTYLGQEFEATAALAEENGQMHWFTQCR